MVSTIVQTILLCIVVLLLALFAGLATWRWSDRRADRAEKRRLGTFQPSKPALFSSSMVEALPEPARRYFTYTLSEGTPLYQVAEITMQGQFSLGSKQNPNYLMMKAHQVLAAPHGFLWSMEARSGLMHLSGSDSGSWTRFWLAGLAPVARFGGGTDHMRSAFGRCIGEAAFWSPATLLPRPDVTWEPVDEDTARVTIAHKGLTQTIDIKVDDEGRPVEVSFLRWSNANRDGVHRLQPFGGFLSRFEEFQGFRLPTHIEAGNFFGTKDYFPFFITDVSSVRFPPNPG